MHGSSPIRLCAPAGGRCTCQQRSHYDHATRRNPSTVKRSAPTAATYRENGPGNGVHRAIAPEATVPTEKRQTALPIPIDDQGCDCDSTGMRNSVNYRGEILGRSYCQVRQAEVSEIISAFSPRRASFCLVERHQICMTSWHL